MCMRFDLNSFVSLINVQFYQIKQLYLAFPFVLKRKRNQLVALNIEHKNVPKVPEIEFTYVQSNL